MFINSIHSKILYSVLIGLFLSSCQYYQGSKLPDVNADFKKSYGSDIQRFQLERELQYNEAVKIQTTQIAQNAASQPKDVDIRPSDIVSSDGTYIDVSRIKIRRPEDILSERNFYDDSARSLQSLPSDMFEVAYNTSLYPAFVVRGAEFDSIEIPDVDWYGVKTSLGDKQYLLAGNDSLQKNVDSISQNRSQDDVAVSKQMIKEREAVRREKKMNRFFGDQQNQDRKKSTTQSDQKNFKSDMVLNGSEKITIADSNTAAKRNDVTQQNKVTN